MLLFSNRYLNGLHDDRRQNILKFTVRMFQKQQYS